MSEKKRHTKGDFAEGEREAPVPDVEPDFARGEREKPRPDVRPDFARGERTQPVPEEEPDFARGEGRSENDLATRSSIMIDAPAAKVWLALTTPELIKRWFFGVDTDTDWFEGSSIVHRGMYQDRPYEDKGTIVKVEPGRLLVHTHWSPVSGLPDRPENYQEVSWALYDEGGKTELVVAESNLLSKAAKERSEQGWSAALAALRNMLENGEGEVVRIGP